jgi:hypothetical protein
LRRVGFLKKAAADPENLSSIDPPLFLVSKSRSNSFIKHGFMECIVNAQSFSRISARSEVSYRENEPFDRGKRQKPSVVELDFGSDLLIILIVGMARENLQVSNAIFIIENFVATTVVWLLPARKFGIG